MEKKGTFTSKNSTATPRHEHNSKTQTQD